MRDLPLRGPALLAVVGLTALSVVAGLGAAALAQESSGPIAVIDTAMSTPVTSILPSPVAMIEDANHRVDASQFPAGGQSANTTSAMASALVRTAVMS